MIEKLNVRIGSRTSERAQFDTLARGHKLVQLFRSEKEFFRR